MKINKPVVTPPIYTHEGAKASRTSPISQLRRSVMACLLWEDSFYEGGEEIAKRIQSLVHQCDAQQVANLAIEARNHMKLRHVPLLLARELCRHKERQWTVYCITNVIRRPDELAELLAIYWKDEGNDKPIPAAMKRGLALAFNRFDAYSLAKYNQDGAVKLRDVMFLVHPKPVDEAQAEVFKKLADGALESPDTWEVQLSAGKNKQETFTRLLMEQKLGALALLRNLRGMTEAGVDADLIKRSIVSMKTEWVLPYRFISAAKHAPQFEAQLEEAMFKCLDDAEKLKGSTALLIDVSGSMQSKVGGKTEITRIEAGCGLAILLREMCESVDIFTFAGSIKTVAPRRGFALRDVVMAQFGGSTKLGAALKSIDCGQKYNRVIVITDEQSEDAVPAPKTQGYMLNVAAYQNGVGYGPWTKIDGWSEACVKYILELENSL